MDTSYEYEGMLKIDGKLVTIDGKLVTIDEKFYIRQGSEIVLEKENNL